VARRRGRGQLATRRVAIWPLLAGVALIVLLHPPLRHGDVTGSVVPGNVVPPERTPNPLGASRPCDIQAIVFQAAKDGRVRPGYSIACLRRARQSLTGDLLTYSDVDEVIRLAIARASSP
jgi:hypothetical protein